MAKYSDIKGFTVQTVSTDPATSQAAGGSWASGENMPANKYAAFPAGTQTALIYAGGATTPPANSNQTNTTYKYDGTNWTAGNNMNETRFNGASFGTQTAAIAASGAKSPGSGRTSAVESWDGTNWTEVNEVNSQRYGAVGIGTQPAGLIAAGYDGSYRDYTETWDGTSWAEVNDLNSAGEGRGGAGTSTAAIAAGGVNSAGTAVVAVAEQWDGTNWTEVGDLNTARQFMGGSGTYTSAILYGGTLPNGAKTEFWDGTSWTEIGDLSTARTQLGGSPAGTSETALAMGGITPSGSSLTEEWSAPAIFTKQTLGQLFYNSTANVFKETVKSIPSGTFASGGALNTARYTSGVCGVSTAAICAGGDFYVGPPNSPSDRSNVLTESYNGSSWTEVGDMNNDIQGVFSMAGSQTAGITNGSQDSPKTYIETWNGSAWSNAPDLNTSKQERCQAAQGSSTASLIVGGYPVVAIVEQFDGSSWTEIADLNTGRSTGRGAGTSSAQIFFGGVSSGSPNGDTKNESWNGTSWTEVGDLPVGRYNHTGLGSQTQCVTTQGIGPNSLGAPNPTGPNSTKAINFWDGVSWSSDADDAPYKARGTGGGGSATDGIVCGGISDPNFTLTTTIEWTVDASNKTISSS